ncbi:MAG TPA: ElyC/SanA/YdcF family protein [Candidatus Dormibacteraeota bacterium]|nr:ElyC/SanA/YdcF family protein [Candidatus Dormibacteraeota bacterium]
MSLAKSIIQSWTGRYTVYGNPEYADCVIGFAFGYRGKRKQAKPGLSNQDLASIAMRRYGKLPKIFQIEIAEAYCDMEAPDCNDPRKIFRVYASRKIMGYLDTREVADQAKQIMDRHKWKSAVILAHPYHIPRVVAVCQKLGIKPIVTSELRGGVEFDLSSSQKWTRSLGEWRGKEPLAMIYYKLKGWV